MLLLIIGLHFILGSIWLMNNQYPMYGVVCFVAGMAATHYGWRQMHRRKSDDKQSSQDS